MYVFKFYESNRFFLWASVLLLFYDDTDSVSENSFFAMLNFCRLLFQFIIVSSLDITPHRTEFNNDFHKKITFFYYTKIFRIILRYRNFQHFTLVWTYSPFSHGSKSLHIRSPTYWCYITDRDGTKTCKSRQCRPSGSPKFLRTFTTGRKLFIIAELIKRPKESTGVLPSLVTIPIDEWVVDLINSKGNK